MFEIPYIDFDVCDSHTKRRGFNKSLSDRYYNMLKRCNNEDHKDYVNYGGRGIKVCDEWLKSKKVFVAWCYENGFEEDLELDRRDNDKGYGPENCRFVTRVVNRNNRRR